MGNLIEMIYEFQLLRGKLDRLGVPLDEFEKRRVWLLEGLLSDEPAAPAGRRGMTRFAVPTRVLFGTVAGFETGEMTNVSGSGLAITTRHPPGIGTRIIVRVEDTKVGVEYCFPCRVVWRRVASNLGMGAMFDGVPTRSRAFGDYEIASIRPRSMGSDEVLERVAAA